MKLVKFAATSAMLAAAITISPRPASAQYSQVITRLTPLIVNAGAYCSRNCATLIPRIDRNIQTVRRYGPPVARAVSAVGGPLQYQTTPQYLPPRPTVRYMPGTMPQSTPQYVIYGH